MAPPSSDRNLLFGILALQMDFVSRKALIEGMQDWLLNKHKTLGEIFVDRGAMTSENVRLLEPLVDAHVVQHGGEVKRCLASVSSDAGLVVGLAEVDDADVQASLGLLPQPEAFQPRSAGEPSMVQHVDGDACPPETPLEQSGKDVADSREGQHTLAEPPVPRQRFRILRPHAEGGLGRVHVALDQELNREVAFKEIKPRHARRTDAQSRFVVEAEITGGLEHPGIVPVYGLGHYGDGRPYYAMRFIRGQSLHDAVRAFHDSDERRQSDGGDRAHDFNGLAFRDLINRLVDVCNAMDYAHSRQVLHRDLKPGNIMLGKYGETLVVDWGLAKPTGAVVSPEQSYADEMPVVPASGSQVVPEVAGQAIGTPAYMPPEQATGRLDQLGPASDVYSLGATLYEILTGRSPLKGLKVTEILSRVQSGDIPGARQIKPNIPAPLDAICRKAMKLNPAERYVSARDLATDLESWLADEPVSAFEEPFAIRARRWIRRHPVAVSTTAACVLMALVGLSAVSTVVTRSNEQLAEKNSSLDLLNQELNSTNAALESSNENERQSRELAEAAQARAEQDRAAARQAAEQALTAREKATAAAAVAKAKTNEARQKLVDQFVGRGQLELDAGRIQKAAIFLSAAFIERDNLPKAMRHAGGDTQLELLLEQSLRQLESRQDELVGHTAAIQSLRFSEDGRWLLSASSDETCKLWNWNSGRVLERSFDDHTDTVTDAFFLDDNRIVTASLDTSARVRTLRLNDEDVETPSFDEHLSGITTTDISPDGRILTGCGRGDLYLWSAGTVEPVLLKSHDVGIRHVAISPTGSDAVSVDEAGGCRHWSLADQSATDLSEEAGIAAVSAAFSSSGDVLIVASRDGEVAFQNVSENKLIGSHAGHRGACTRIVPQPDSSRVASLGEDGQVVLWESTGGTVVQRIQLPDNARGVRDAVFHDDGELLLTVDDAGYLRVWDTRHGRLRQEFRAHQVVASALAAHPDGRHVVTAGIDGTLRVWEIQQHFKTTVLPGDDGVTWADFSPDGKRYTTSYESGVARVYETGTHQQFQDFVHSTDDWVKQAHFSLGDGNRLLTIGGRTARLFDVETGESIWSLPEIDEELVVSAAQFVGRDDAFVIALRKHGSVGTAHENEGWYFWDLSENQTEAIRRGLVNSIRGLQFSPDQRVLAVLHGPENGTIWRFDSGDRNGGISGATCAVFPSTGQLMWGMLDGTLRLTRYDTDWEISRSDEASPSAICAIASLGNGNQVVVGTNDGQISIQDRVNCSLVRHMKSLNGDGARYITSLAVSPDSSLISAGTVGGAVGLWEPESGELVGQWFADDVISTVTFSPDSSNLLFSSRDGSVRHVRIPRLENTHDEVAARVWRLTQFEEVTGDRQYREAVASLEQTINAGTGQKTKPDGFQNRDLRTLREAIQQNIATHRSDVAAQNIHQILSRPDVTSGEAVGLRFLLARMQEKFTGLRYTLQSHGSAVHEIRIAPDESSFLTISADRTARLWSLPDARPLHTLNHDSIVWDGQYSPDGNLVAIIGFDRDVNLWNAHTGELEHALSSHCNRIGDLGFSPDGNRLITGSRDQTAILWDVPTGQPLSTLEGHSDYVLHAKIDPTGKFAVTASRGEAWPRVWDVETGQLVTEIQLTESPDAELRVNDLRFSESGSLYVFPCSDGTVRLWDSETEQVTTLSGHKGPVNDAAFSQDGTVCVSVSDDGTARVWELKEEDPVERQVWHHSPRDSIDRLRCLPDHSRAVTACGRTVRVWDIESGQLQSEFAGHEDSPVENALTPDGNTVITGARSGKIRVWSVNDDRPLAPSRLPHRIAHSWPIGSDRLLIADEAGQLELIDHRSARSLSKATSSHVEPTGLAWFAVDRKTGIYAATTPEGKLITGICQDDVIEEPRLVSIDNRFIGKVTVSTDWSRLAVQVAEHTIAVWNPGSDEKPAIWDAVHDNITALSLSRDGSLLASAGDNIVRLWNVEDRSLVAEFRGHVQPVEALAITDDGKRIISGSRDHSGRIWSVDSQSVEHFLYGHTAAVNRIVRDETGDLVLTLSIDGQAIIWDIVTGHRVCQLRSDSEAILQAEFLHNAALVVTATSSGAIRVWNLANGKVIYSYAEKSPSTCTCHVLADEAIGTRSILAVSKSGFVEQWPATIEQRSMDDDALIRTIRCIAGSEFDKE